MNFGEHWEKSKLHHVLKGRRYSIFPSKIVTSPNCLKFHMHVSGGDSNKFCIYEFWRTLSECQNFILFWMSSAVGIFPSKIVTSPNCLKFHMHVSGDEFWRTLRKCQNFILFWRSSAVGIFPSKIVTPPNCLKFHMHVSGGDSNKFCNFHEFFRTLRKVKTS